MADAEVLDLDAIEAREREATHGPWRAVAQECPLNELGRAALGTCAPVIMRGIETADDHPQLKGRMPIICPSVGPYHEPTHRIWLSEADAQFIAAARTDVPALCAEVRRLRAQVPAGQPPAASESPYYARRESEVL